MIERLLIELIQVSIETGEQVPVSEKNEILNIELMPRQSRQPSGTGLYHVMMRGINHQNISDLRSSLLTLDNAQASLALYSLNRSLEEYEDYYQFLNTLDMMAKSYIHHNPVKAVMMSEVKGLRASLHQLERLNGIQKSMIYHM